MASARRESSRRGARSAVFLGALCALLGACGGPSAPPADPAGRSAPSPGRTKAVVAIAPVTLRGANGSSVAMDARGEIVAEGKRIGKLLPDGRLLDDRGEEVLRIDGDGLIFARGKGGEPADARIAEDGTVHLPGGKTLRIGEGGALSSDDPDLFPPEDLAQLRVDVARPEARRAAMLLLLTLTVAPSGGP